MKLRAFWENPWVRAVVYGILLILILLASI